MGYGGICRVQLILLPEIVAEVAIKQIMHLD